MRRSAPSPSVPGPCPLAASGHPARDCGKAPKPATSATNPQLRHGWRGTRRAGVVRIVPVAQPHRADWIAMRQALWPDELALEAIDAMLDPASGPAAWIAPKGVHRAIGLEETGRVVYFRRPLGPR